MTLIAALVAFLLTYHAEKRRRHIDELKVGASEALSGFSKLSQLANLISNINSQIDTSFVQAHEFNLIPNDASLIVGPSAGLFVEPERLKLSEYKFLMSKENFGLADDIILAEQRALNTHHLYKMYSEMHLEMQAWMDEIPGLERSLDGVISTDAIPKTHILQAEMRVAQLNRLIVGVVESLEGDIAQMINLTNSFLEVAHDLYGPYFPKIKFS
jgi:hypothetical protein